MRRLHVQAQAQARPRRAVQFRPCIDIHKGKVKQIVGSTLKDLAEEGAQSDKQLVTNFVSDKSAGEYARMYKEVRILYHSIKEPYHIDIYIYYYELQQ